MDFANEFFWVLMLVLYLVFQVIGARKKNRQIEQKRRKSSEPPERVGAPSGREPELDEALQEIRRALGFPDTRRESPRPIPPPLEEEVPQTTSPEPRRVERSPTVELPPRPRPAPEPPVRPTVSRPQPRPQPVRIPPKQGRVSTPQRESHARPSPPPVRTDAGGIYSMAEKKAFQNKYGLEEIDRPLSEAHPGTAPEGQAPTGVTAASHVVRRLKDASSAREAFLLKEILDRPRATRRLR